MALVHRRLLAVLFLLSTSLSAQQLQQDLDGVREALDAAQQTLRERQAQRDELSTLLAQSQSQVQTLNERTETLTTALERARAAIAPLQEALDQLQQERDRDLQQVAHSWAQRYREGQNPNLRLVLSVEQPSAVARTLAYQEYLQQYRREQLGALEQRGREYDALLDSHQRERDALQQQQLALLEQLEKQSKTLESHRSLLASAQRRFDDAAEHRRLLLAEQESLQRLLTQVSELATRDHDFLRRQGELPWPLRGQVQHQFGEPRGNSGLRWQGWFISAPSQAVSAIHPGRVVYSDWLGNYGQLLIIDHGQGFLSLYGNVEALLRRTGDEVLEGELVARTGTSILGEGLYFEIRAGSEPSDPRTWLNPAVVIASPPL